MRYELPKSYANRMAANAYPQPTVPRAQPSPPPPAEFRPRSPQAPAPQPRSAQAATQTTAQPATQSTSQATNTVPASTYQRLLVELQSRNREHEHLKQVTQKLLADLSELQAKYEQAITAPPDRLSVAQMPFSRGAAQHHNQQQPLPPDRRKIGNVLPNLSFLDRLRHPNRTTSKRPAANPSDSSAATTLPELSFLNRLRQANRHNPDLSSTTPAIDGPSVRQPTSIESNTPEPQQPVFPLSATNPHTASGRDHTAVEPTLVEPPEPLHSVLPIGGEYADDYGYDSPYQKARQEHAKNTPLWMWLVAWLLLLPISAGLGYTFVQWVMNPGASVESPPAIEQAE